MEEKIEAIKALKDKGYEFTEVTADPTMNPSGLTTIHWWFEKSSSDDDSPTKTVSVDIVGVMPSDITVPEIQ